MRSDVDRATKYDSKVVPATVSLKVAAMLPQMKTTFSGGTTALVDKQLQVAAILDNATIVGCMRGRYHAFSNRLFWITRNFSGPAATQMAQMEHDKWESVCQSAIMINIAFNVYSLVVA